MTGGTIVPVILSGGSGTRLWPMSRPERPKQFLPLTADTRICIRSPRPGTHIRVTECQRADISGRTDDATGEGPGALRTTKAGRQRGHHQEEQRCCLPS